MLAYYVEHHMRNALAPILFANHQPQARARASIVRPAQPSAAAAAKIRKRQASDGSLARSHGQSRLADDQRGGVAAGRPAPSMLARPAPGAGVRPPQRARPYVQ
jgi:hypothetical protein